MATTTKKESLNVLQRLHRVMEQVGNMTPDGRNTFQKYNFVSEQKITLNVQTALIAHGILVYPIEESIETVTGNSGVLCTVTTKYRCANIDKIDEYIDVISSASDIDKTGAHVPKAKTMCYKFMWRQLFAIACGDDPDKKRNVAVVGGKAAELDVEPVVENDNGNDELF